MKPIRGLALFDCECNSSIEAFANISATTGKSDSMLDLIIIFLGEWSGDSFDEPSMVEVDNEVHENALASIGEFATHQKSQSL
jgi:hypothetical protein